jgi:hypothetical protein
MIRISVQDQTVFETDDIRKLKGKSRPRRHQVMMQALKRFADDPDVRIAFVGDRESGRSGVVLRRDSHIYVRNMPPIPDAADSQCEEFDYDEIDSAIETVMQGQAVIITGVEGKMVLRWNNADLLCVHGEGRDILR